MTNATTAKVLSYDEMLHMPEATDLIEEVIDGEIRTMPPNKSRHVFSVENLADALRAVTDRTKVRILTANFGLVIRQNPVTCRVPDLAVFVIKNMVIRDGYFFSPPELIVEVLSPGNTRRDQARLMRDYESLGVPEVWLLSPESRIIEVLQLDGGRLKSVAIRNSGKIALRVLPQAVIDIGDIWP